MDSKKFGEFIATIRKEKGWTQAELAEKISVTDKAVSRWERGLGFPDIMLITTVAPFDASFTAIAFPIPLDAPVTTATFPSIV